VRTSFGKLRLSLILFTTLVLIIFAFVSLVISVVKSNSVNTIALYKVPIPPLKVPHYRTSGDIIQVAQNGKPLSIVNQQLMNAVVQDENSYSITANEAELSMYSSPGTSAIQEGLVGSYISHLNLSLVTANSKFVSAMIPMTRLFPGGTDGSEWLSVTISTSTGSTISMQQVIGNIEKFKSAVAHGIMHGSVLAYCGTSFVKSTQLSPFIPMFLSVPNSETYFSLSSNGVMLAYSNGVIVPPSCGGLLMKIPMTIVRTYLTRFGVKLLS
jgi:hypothetical protein